MTGIGEVISLVGASKAILDATNATSSDKREVLSAGNKAKQIYNVFRNVESIAQKARKSIMMYPVIVSDALQDTALMTKIVKHLEVEYGIFTVIVSGLHTLGVESAVLRDISTESLFEETDSHSMESYEELLKGYHRPTRKLGLEASMDDDDDNNLVIVTNLDGGKGPSNNKQNSGGGNSNNTQSRPHNGGGSGRAIVDSRFLQSAEKISRTAPLVVNIPITIGNDNVMFPVIVKANPHIVTGEEATLILGRAYEQQNILRRVIRLTTGEIKFFRDFIGEEDKAAKDKELYERLGRHPFYRTLLGRKNASRGRKIIREGFGKNELAVKGDIPPTTTLVVTKDEVERAIGVPYGRFSRDKKYLEKIMKELMLLGIVVYNPQTGYISTHYLGYDEPSFFNENQLKTEKDVQSSLTESIANLSRKV